MKHRNPIYEKCPSFAITVKYQCQFVMAFKEAELLCITISETVIGVI